MITIIAIAELMFPTSQYSYFSKIRNYPEAPNHIIMGELVRIILSNLGHRFLVLRQGMSQKFLCPML